MLKYFIIAGEFSGDYHGGKLIKAIKAISKNSSFLGHGGDNMSSEGMEIIEHINKLSIMGFSEVLKHLPRIKKIFDKTIDLIKTSQPDRIILIDYPGFNLRIAKKIHHLGIPITYFILPQAWAWKERRVEGLKQYCTQLISIFPFERDWFLKKGVKVQFFGHPFLDIKPIETSKRKLFTKHGFDIKKPILLLFPGSRQQEINKHFPILIDTVTTVRSTIPELQILVGQSPHTVMPKIPEDFRIEKNSKNATIISTAALVASGTATLECALAKLPIVVYYKFSFLTWIAVKALVKVPFSSIVNLISNKEIVPELLQKDMTSKKLSEKIIPLLNKNSKDRINMLNNFSSLSKSLGKTGVYNKIAKSIITQKS